MGNKLLNRQRKSNPEWLRIQEEQSLSDNETLFTLSNARQSISGFQIQKEPQARDYSKRCEKCNTMQPDYGLNHSFECPRCESEKALNNILSHPKSTWLSCITNTISKIPLCHLRKNFVPRSYDAIEVKVNKDTIENENINYTELIQSYLIPFFSSKSRLVSKGNIITVNNIDFKIFSVYPSYEVGKVSKKTYIRCFECFSERTCITRVLMIASKKYSETTDRIKRDIYSTPNKKELCITKNSNVIINNYEFYIKNCTPDCGTITNETNITLECKKIENIRRIKLAIIKQGNDTDEFFTDRKNEKIIIEQYYKPYFLSGTSRYIERGDVFTIGDLNLFVLNSYPSCGYIVNNSLVKFKYGKTKEECLEKINRADNKIVIEMDERHLSLPQRRFHTEIPIFHHNHLSIRAIPLRILGEYMINRSAMLEAVEREHRNELSNNSEDLERVIQNLPVFKVDEKYMGVIEKSDEESIKKCVICMERFTLGEKIKTLPCCKFILFYF